jgi:hypothetical protein
VQLGVAAILVAGYPLCNPAAISSASANTTPNPNTFGINAEADGINVEVSFPGELPIVQSVSASPWGASATLDSLGGSNAFAGTPYSPFLYSLPGTVNGLGSGQVPPLPALPGEVSSSYPTSPSASQTTGPYSVSAQSGPSQSSGTVADGASPPGSTNTTIFASAKTVANSDGSVVTSAATGVDFLNLGGLLDIGNVSSSETMTEAGSQAPTVSGRNDFGTVTLLGTTAGLVDHNLLVGGTGVPIPLSTTVLPALNAALQAAGVSLAFIPQTFAYTDGSSSTGASPDSAKTLQAVDSGALQVTLTRAIPGQGTITIIDTLGRVFVSATNTASASYSPSVVDTGSVPPVTGSSIDSTATSVGPVGVQQPPESLSPASPALASPTSGSIGAIASSPTTPTFRRALTSSVPQIFYLILVIGALAALASSFLVRHLGIRLNLAR